MRDSAVLRLASIIIFSIAVLSCNKNFTSKAAGYRIVHDTDDQSLTAITLKSDGGILAATLNTFSEDQRSLDFGLMNVDADNHMISHLHQGYHYGACSFTSIIEASPDVFIGINYNITTDPGSRRSVLVKMNGAGDILDSIVVTASGNRIRYGQIIKCSDGNFVLTGAQTNGTNTYSYVMKFDLSLNKLWDLVINGSDIKSSNFRAFTCVENSDHSIILGGTTGTTTVYSGTYTLGRLALVKISNSGVLDTFSLLKYNQYRIVSSMTIENSKLIVFSSARVVQDADTRRELSVNTFSLGLDSISQHRVRHPIEAWLDANFLVKRKGGWFACGFAEGPATFFYYSQKPYLFLLDENFNVVSSRRLAVNVWRVLYICLKNQIISIFLLIAITCRARQDMVMI